MAQGDSSGGRERSISACLQLAEQQDAKQVEVEGIMVRVDSTVSGLKDSESPFTEVACWRSGVDIVNLVLNLLTWRCSLTSNCRAPSSRRIAGRGGLGWSVGLGFNRVFRVTDLAKVTKRVGVDRGEVLDGPAVMSLR